LQEYFVYFKIFAQSQGENPLARRVRRFIQRFLKYFFSVYTIFCGLASNAAELERIWNSLLPLVLLLLYFSNSLSKYTSVRTTLFEMILTIKGFT